MAGPLQPMRWLVALKRKDGFWKQRWGSNSQLMTDHIGGGENKKIPGHRAGDWWALQGGGSYPPSIIT